ncbi:3',5'-cyclic-AMP phosphodiesterase [Mergibacter septicus]|uniref:3',5'-cyclic adenosine monophosphate phosphodiesterase CpdA n=1 Tax=Mergibacter septicus TaxID=221402 RepID=A0A8E3MC22_9PAST|nr:3',5'-cyclic-AMP phosphodiesterase [Mergibacter septicus]AWX15978.1 3',5'-cyclic-AMP phosphodiesterase [Mergibacter septicus]QDJ12503.1 3',5'-cyclic-AMP phosphodiesterase [Mergibacter septicus]QDJ15231.1 3',5'-cyclic-AMP phosphodiesterase [Mergibacter septicus]UTU47351.1 3',5'-cyclic-AMP phosphodiesterase [Mergibacter septicus]WMR95471.1 3',5'-cyclic-AMP phosphodiesterase [Mergibacter septicus]
MSGIYQHTSVSDVVKVLQLTDPHLFADSKGELLGVNTLESFKQVVREVIKSNFAYELILATGDFVQDDSREAYQHFVQQVSPLIQQTDLKPLFWLPGNHDFQPNLLEVFQYSKEIYPEKHLLLGEYWQVLLLDSQVAGAVYGKLSQEQLQWLDQQLALYPQRHALIAFHHHLVPTNSAWLDQHNLRNSYQLLEILQRHQQVKVLMYGHIHQAVDTNWYGYRVLATPSTGIQFKPDCAQFTLDNLQPGWREISLYPNGEIVTTVKRIEEKLFLPNVNVSGY